jgi:hypothetical protein
MHSLHHILLDYCDYLMMQSYLWQMVHTRATDDDMLDIPEGSALRGCGCGQPLMAMHRRHHHVHWSTWSNYWLCRMSS